VVTPASLEQLCETINTRPQRGIIARGLGRSYGDPAQNAGGTVLDMTALTAVRDFDVQRGRITVDAGISLDRLMRLIVPFGWFVPVTPGTRYVTVGGAIACDIHGKNHHLDSGFAAHVLSVHLLTTTGELLTITPDANPTEFWSTAGGMGLTGFIVQATVQLLHIESSEVLVESERHGNLDSLMAAMAASDYAHRYSVAWVDLLARGRQLGRGILYQGNHAPPDRPDATAASGLSMPNATRLFAPNGLPKSLVSRASVRAFNEVWYYRQPRVAHVRRETLPNFFHQLDMVRQFNNVYGPAGFVQHQFVVPSGAEETVRRVIERYSAWRAPAFLVVLKRMGRQQGLLSFPMEGWTLTVDLPANLPGLGDLLDWVDEQVVDAGGRLYLAKDARMRPELLPVMYPQLDAWRTIADRLDPERRLQSDLNRRLGLRREGTPT
jgi:decaprenylphospho-beta-D-ribofuranose 2-oxidase